MSFVFLSADILNNFSIEKKIYMVYTHDRNAAIHLAIFVFVLGGIRMKAVSLCEAYRDYFSIGAAVNSRSVDTHADLLKVHFNSITAENEMKFERLHPEPEVYDFEKADILLRFARENGMRMRGHTLVWHNQTPSWVFRENGLPRKKESLLAVMKDHIRRVTSHFSPNLYCWDVVNEAVEDKGSNILRRSPWLEIAGEDFLKEAFVCAKESVPEASLYYNDYNACVPEKREKICTLLRRLLEEGAPVDGFGIQGHWNITAPQPDEIRRSIEAYASLGLKLQITELDLSLYAQSDPYRPEPGPAPEELLIRQTKLYEEIFHIFREYRDVIEAVTFWGVADDDTWLDRFFEPHRANRPLLFDEEHKPKAAFRAVTQF